jgi:hypothetical protein
MPAPINRAAELEEIESFLYARGVTRCPPRYAGSVSGALPRETEMALLAAITVKPWVSFQELHDRFFDKLPYIALMAAENFPRT